MTGTTESDRNGLRIPGEDTIDAVLFMTDMPFNWDIVDKSIALCNREAGAAPTVHDGLDLGYASGSFWGYAGKVYYCISALIDAANWVQIWPPKAADISDLIDHGSQLTGLTDDDHVGYALLAGRASGQILKGGTGASETLNLMSTAHATKGKLLFGISAYDEVNNRLGIGTQAPSDLMELVKDAANLIIYLTNYNGSNASHNAIIGRASRGTLASPTAVQADDELISIRGRGYGASAMGASSRAYIALMSAEAWTDAAQGTYLIWALTTPGGIITAEKMRLNSIGLGVGRTPATYPLEIAGDIYATGDLRGTYIRGDGSLLTNLPAAGSAFWTNMPTISRVADDVLGIVDTGNAGHLEKYYVPGMILRWEKSGGGFQCAMIKSSVYNPTFYTTGGIQINILGNTLADGFTAMKYCIHPAYKDVFIVPGTMPGNTATTDIGKTIYATCDMLVLAAQSRYKTAPTTTNGVWDINDDGTSVFTTKLVQTAGQTNGVATVCDCVLATADMVVAKDSLITLDYDSGHATTPGADAYIEIYWMPEAWRYLS